MANNNNNTPSYESVLKGATKEKSIIFNLRKTYPAYIVLILTLIISATSYVFMKNKVTDDRKVAFEKAVTAVLTRLDRKVELNEGILSSMQGLFVRSFVVKDVFELNGSIPVSSFKSIVSIDYAFKTKPEGIEDFLYNARSGGNYEIVLHPEGNNREIYYIIDYIVPFDKNKARAGFDFASDEITKKAIEKARDNNIITSTEFHQIRDNIKGFYLIAPAYYKDQPINTDELKKINFEGAIVLEIDEDKFFEEAIGTGIATDSTIIFDIFDNNSSGERYKIFSSKNAILLENKEFKPIVSETKKFKIADREIEIDFHTIPNFGGEFQNYLPLLTLGGTVVTSFVLFGFIISVITSRARALDLAERMTRSQRRIVDTSKDVISVFSFDGTWKSMNNASRELFGNDPNTMIGQNIKDLFLEDVDYNSMIAMVNSSKEEETKRADYRMKKSTGEVVWVSWSFTFSHQDNLIYSIGRDVTLEKIAEEQSRLRTKQIQLAEQFAREASESKTYFLTKLGHQLRNSLTGIVGYLQLVSGKAYENEEELDMFVGMAAESSEELFTFVSDLIDNAEQSEEAIRVNIATLNFENVIKATQTKIATETKTKFELIVNNEGNTKLVGDMNIIVEAMIKVFEAMSGDKTTCKLELTAQENHSEGATEIQILAEANPLVEEMIKLYKENKSHIIEALQYDKKDIILDLSIVESNIRRLNGTMMVDTLGKDGNYITLTLPLQHS